MDREHAFLWQNGVMQDLGTLGGDSSVALDINIHGQVVGAADTPITPQNVYGRAFIWENGQIIDLNQVTEGIPQGVLLQVAWAINDNGYIVGDTCGEPTGFLCEAGTVPHNSAFLLIPTEAD
ncbi:MAG: hypothetical protein HC853_12930 [Anaerolineae bacterium]|nr:hypothetical protein [Anaerolineae bacterium]